MLTFVSLFAGIGGMDLGLERAGMKCIAQVEIDPFCRKVLAKHWPNVPKFEDVRTFNRGSISEKPDLICGGFPCQDISAANYRAEGISGQRSGLWSEFLRIIRDFRPSLVLIENVTALAFRGLGTVLRDIAASGLDAEWQTISAQMLGAPHGRERLFIVAYAPSVRRKTDEIFDICPPQTTSEKQKARLRRWPGVRKPSAALPDRFRWCPDSKLCGMVNGIPDQLDRYKQCGNSIVPEVAEWIGRRLLDGLSSDVIL